MVTPTETCAFAFCGVAKASATAIPNNAKRFFFTITHLRFLEYLNPGRSEKSRRTKIDLKDLIPSDSFVGYLLFSVIPAEDGGGAPTAARALEKCAQAGESEFLSLARETDAGEVQMCSTIDHTQPLAAVRCAVLGTRAPLPVAFEAFVARARENKQRLADVDPGIVRENRTGTGR